MQYVVQYADINSGQYADINSGWKNHSSYRTSQEAFAVKDHLAEKGHVRDSGQFAYRVVKATYERATPPPKPSKPPEPWELGVTYRRLHRVRLPDAHYIAAYVYGNGTAVLVPVEMDAPQPYVATGPERAQWERVT
jgi:hypothetical protein